MSKFEEMNNYIERQNLNVKKEAGAKPKPRKSTKSNKNKAAGSVKKMVLLAMLTTIALTIFVVESAIPTLIPIPGVKLGLANIVTLFVIKRMSVSDAAEVLFMRIVLATMFAGQAVSFIYSMFGGFLCLIMMGMVNKFLNGRYIFLTSIAGAISHNMGQIMAAFLVLKMSGIFLYIPFLIISGVITGLFTGLVCYFADRYIPADLS